MKSAFKQKVDSAGRTQTKKLPFLGNTGVSVILLVWNGRLKEARERGGKNAVAPFSLDNETSKTGNRVPTCGLENPKSTKTEICTHTEVCQLVAWAVLHLNPCDPKNERSKKLDAP